jgi:hypothetical protein
MWLLSSAPTARSTQTVAVMRECPNCTEAQMRNMAKAANPLGVKFIYDLPHHVIHRYLVYMDSDCRPEGPGIKNSVNVGSGGETDSGNDTDCGSYREADLIDPVDPGVMGTFNGLYSAWQANLTLATTGDLTRVGSLPNDPLLGQPYKPHEIAWDYPQGKYDEFMNTLTQVLLTKNSANGFAPGLGDMIYVWAMPSFSQTLNISGQPGLAVTLAWDRSSTVTLHMCVAPEMDCVNVKITMSATGVQDIEYKGTTDFNHNLYPSENGTAPGNMGSWHFRNGGGAHFGNEMRQGGVDVPTPPTCGYAMHLFIQISRVGGRIFSVDQYCVAN